MNYSPDNDHITVKFEQHSPVSYAQPKSRRVMHEAFHVACKIIAQALNLPQNTPGNIGR
jgi:hypothetical protein